MNHVCGTFPLALYRCFSQREHAEAFLSGKILVRRNTFYRSIECAQRRDGDEGEAYYLKRGLGTTALVSRDERVATEWVREERLIARHSSFGNAVFLLCCAGQEADLAYLRKRFGEHVVRLDDPRALAADIAAALHTNGQRFLVDGRAVSYSRGTEIADNISDNQLVDLAYTQKAPAFSEEKEFRYCLIGMGPERQNHVCDQQELWIRLARPIANARLLATP